MYVHLVLSTDRASDLSISAAQAFDASVTCHDDQSRHIVKVLLPELTPLVPELVPYLDR